MTDSERSPLHHSTSSAHGSSGDQQANTNLFVTGLAPRVNEKDLEDLFSKYGKVDKIQIMRDPHSQDSRGFGFVSFGSLDEAEAALALDGFELMDKPLIVQKAKRARARTPTPGSYRGAIKDHRRDYRDRGDYYDRRRDYDRYDRRPPYYDRGYDRREPPRGGYYDRRDERDYDRRHDDRRGGYGYERDRRGPPPDYDQRSRPAPQPFDQPRY